MLATLPKALCESILSYQVDPKELADRAGFDHRRLGGDGSRISDESKIKLIRLSLHATGDPCLGLTVASYIHPTIFSVLGFSWLASPTLRDVFVRLIKYKDLLLTGDSVRLEWQDAASALRLSFHQMDDVTSAFRADVIFAVMTWWCRELNHDYFAPTKVELRHSDHGQPQRYEDYFKATVEFGSEVDQIYFPDGPLGELLPNANQALAVDMDHVAAGYIAGLAESDVTSNVRRILLDLLPQGEASADEVARRLHMSRRSLQRHLTEEGHTFRHLANETRKALAIEYIRDGRHSLIEVAFRLGFSDQSAFSKAFRRWTGMSPGAFRT